MDMNAPVSPRENGNATGGLYAQPRDLLPKPMDAQPLPPQRAPVYDASVPPQYPVSQKQSLVMPPPAPLQQQEMTTQPQVNVAQLQKELAYYRQQNGGGSAGRSTAPSAASSPSFFDQLWSKRREVVKMVTISMIILLAISSHTVLDHYMKDWIQGSDFTANQELMARASYPLAVLATLWFVKAFYR